MQQICDEVHGKEVLFAPVFFDFFQLPAKLPPFSSGLSNGNMRL